MREFCLNVPGIFPGKSYKAKKNIPGTIRENCIKQKNADIGQESEKENE